MFRRRKLNQGNYPVAKQQYRGQHGQQAVAPMNVQLAAPGIDWSQYWSEQVDDYRLLTNLQIFGTGLALHAGKPPTLQAPLAGLDAVFQYVMNTAMWPPPQGAGGEERADAAAQLAKDTGLMMYEQDVIDACLSQLIPKWKSQYGLQLAIKNPSILIPVLGKPGRLEARARAAGGAGSLSTSMCSSDDDCAWPQQCIDDFCQAPAATSPIPSATLGLPSIAAPAFPSELIPYEEWAVQAVGSGNPGTLFTSQTLGNAAFNNLYGPTLLGAGIVDGKIPPENQAAGGWQTGWKPWVEAWWRMVERAAEWLGQHPNQAQPVGPQPVPSSPVLTPAYFTGGAQFTMTQAQPVNIRSGPSTVPFSGGSVQFASTQAQPVNIRSGPLS